MIAEGRYSSVLVLQNGPKVTSPAAAATAAAATAQPKDAAIRAAKPAPAAGVVAAADSAVRVAASATNRHVEADMGMYVQMVLSARRYGASKSGGIAGCIGPF